jgi:hypothetical protein
VFLLQRRLLLPAAAAASAVLRLQLLRGVVGKQGAV